MTQKNHLKFLSIMLVVLIAIAAVAFVVMYRPPTQYTPTSYEVNNFTSYHAFTEFLSSATGGSGYYYSLDGVSQRNSAGAPLVEDMATNGKATDGGQSVDYSQTNVQVAGVDEPDIVKTDGTYLYIVSKNKVMIVYAYPAENASIEATVTLNESLSIQNLFISGSRLVIFAQSYGSYPILYKYEAVGIRSEEISVDPWYDSQDTFIEIYDLETISNPVLVKEIVVGGSFSNARLIGNYVYVITTQYSYMSEGDDYSIIPRILINGEPIDVPLSDIYYVDTPIRSSALTNIVSVNIHDDEEQIHQNIYLLGSTQTLYVSQENIFITCPNYYYYDDTFMQQIIDDLIAPILPPSVKTQLDSVDTLDLEEYQKQEITFWILQKYIQDSMPEDQKNQIKQEVIRRTEQTIIHRISINNGEITYESQGSVSGYVNNQFSLDQYNDYLRVSTTIQGGSLWYIFGSSIDQETNVYVLDMELNIVGSLEDITPDSGEQIYATRFINDLCYLVTFRQTDPFFVIDLSDPTTPTVLGELKIPGFSTYLHPYDDTHIIGIGRNNQNVKISLFDVTDMSNPIELTNYTIENPDQDSWWWTESVALYEHKAFLFNKDKHLLVLPVGNYSQQNAYVFDIALETGIDLKGMVIHDLEVDEEEPYWWYGSSGNTIQRTLYIENVLYTVSTNMVKMNDLSTLDELNSVALV